MNKQTEQVFRKNPMLLILIAYASGIGVMCFIPLKLRIPFLFSALSLCFISLLLSLSILRWRSAFRGLVLLSALFLAGVIQYTLAVAHANIPEQPQNYTAVALTAPQMKERSTYIDATIVQSETEDSCYTFYNEKIRVFLGGNTDSLVIWPGDSLVFAASVQQTKNTSNPGSFRYDRYLNTHGIWYSCFLQVDDLEQGSNSGEFPLRKWSAMIQSRIVQEFQHAGISGQELAVAAALVAGDKMYLTDNLKSGYSIAGALHVLAVSGLHVGILYLFLQLFLFKGMEQPVFRISRFILILLCLWAYAFITGLSPSVLRAATMFSLFHLGKSTRRSIGGLNNLAASAVIILAVNPLQLFQVGFQFSYLAVLGILIFYNRIESALTPGNFLLQKIWQLTALSLSVQVTTFPISLHYFNQFPSYFLLTNLFAIPLVWLIMMGSILFFLTLPIGFISWLVALMINVLLTALNAGVSFVTQLPYALIEPVRFTPWHLVAGFLIVLACIRFPVKQDWKRLVFWSTFLILCVLVVDSVVYYKHEYEKEFIVYNTRSNTYISLINGHNHLLLIDVEDSSSVSNDILYLEQYWIDKQINKQLSKVDLTTLAPGALIHWDKASVQAYDNGYYINFNGKTYHYLLQSDRTIVSPAPDADILIISNKSGYPGWGRDIKQVDEIIFSRSSWYSQRQAWMSRMNRENTKSHTLGETGGYQEITKSALFYLE